MAVTAVTAVPWDGSHKPGNATRFTLSGTSTNTETLQAGVASTYVYIWKVILNAVDGGTWVLNIGDTSDGTVVSAEGDATATTAVSTLLETEAIVFRGGGSATASENNLILTADGAGECHYTVLGWTVL